ncbi:hypothetical protein [Salibaculum griseiflavum]|uniref:Uncharacterized protein n=1 Tax=Salibaculum griseiflavum TaxID=1914409 RepID=A0A2V1P897_9RHOB|nr:hypothetical protein [Salibaculum griseiflavum]PWG17432.1 hypothetical protein DFK10_06600 [Salibaculum griseiflavum]
MDRLELVLLFCVFSPTLSGVCAIAVMWLGYYSWPAILGSSLVGLLFAWPVSRYFSRSIERKQSRDKLISDLARENDSSADDPSCEE